ncbi:hypothetical protein SI65_08367 [Aspergillus cristatus]|uniref:Uncharacterized protein n=1 Tax=Aspergillus cristatus TaxID=573508 RepID=A0A1E3B5Y6_ASPCR|nr:hypothetical protein SI65_08367 [Aspergillus cristatus]
MGVRKRIAPATQAHYRLRATKLRQEKRLEQLNGTKDADMGEAPEVHETPTAPSPEPATPQQSPEQLRPEILEQAQHFPYHFPGNQYLPAQPEQDTPPATPTHESPQIQLGLDVKG